MPGICPRCLREVYFAEEKLALGKVWHCLCFSCRNCRKLLDSWTVATHADDLFCRNCYNRLFSTTSVRPTIPLPVNSIVPAIDKIDFGVAGCDSVSDYSCYCCCEEGCSFIKEQSQDLGLEELLDCSSEKRRLRGGGGGSVGEEKELASDRSLELGTKKPSVESQASLLDHRTSDTSICHRSSSVGGPTASYTRHHSDSESTFGSPTSRQQTPMCISCTPNSGDALDLHQNCNLSCSVHQTSDSPHLLNKKLCQHSKECHHHHCHEYNKTNRVRAFQERSNIEKNCRGKNIIGNSRVHFRSGVRYTAMQNSLDEHCNNADIVSFEHSAYEDDGNADEEKAPSDANISVDVDTDGDVEDIGDCKDVRMRGGCGGEGSNCCCSSAGGGTRLGFDHSTKSSCCRRYRKERSSTVEGACGCSGRTRSSDCGNSVSTDGCCSGAFEEISVHSPRAGGCCGVSHDDIHDGACASKAERLPMNRDTCPPRLPDPCSSDPSSLSSCGVGACSPPCSGRKGCCPPAGCTPVRRRIVRCNAPCTGYTQSCGGGGFCGSGCRGGCGKPGQTCLPSRPCTIPPCKVHPGGGGSPCMPPRRCAPQPPCCRILATPGTSDSMSGTGRRGGASCRSAVSGGRTAGGGGCSLSTGCQQQEQVLPFDSCCQPKLPAGCECLGGGHDCQRCGRKVYQAEMQIASGVPYHNICFSCFCCRKPLETLTYHENCGEIYCKQCYVRNFGPQGYGYAGVLQTPM